MDGVDDILGYDDGIDVEDGDPDGIWDVVGSVMEVGRFEFSPDVDGSRLFCVSVGSFDEVGRYDGNL